MLPRDRDVLLDTGPLVSVLDRRDSWHRECLDQWNRLSHRCVTTEAVLTEACHLIDRSGGRPHIPVDLLTSAEVPICALESSGHRYASHLMRKYTDVPMDYADATLMVLSEALGISKIFTLDRKGFRTYKRSDGTVVTLFP